MARFVYQWRNTEHGKRLFRSPGAGSARRRAAVAAAPPPEPPEDDTAGGQYDDLTKAELVDLADSRGLSKYGNKPDLIARLEEADDE